LLPRFQLVRVKEGYAGTRGVLSSSVSDLVLVTLELAWRNNQPNKSRIPSGKYELAATKDRHLPNGDLVEWTYEVLKVTDRSGILFHHGNYPHNSSGCILVGYSFAGGPEYETILNSRTALAALGRVAKNYPKAELEIYDNFPEADHENR